MFGTGIANAILSYTKIIGFRIGYMTQWTWPPVLFIAMWFAPDAPWWLVRKNRIAEAENAVKKLTHPSMHDQAPGIVQSMVRTYQLEVDVSAGARWIDCFKGPDRRRTEIACMAFACQSLCEPAYFAELYLADAREAVIPSAAMSSTSFSLLAWRRVSPSRWA